MEPSFDLAIVGGGPAGAACALAAARAGSSVALFEAQPTLCDKPCGEGLMPPGIDALRELGLDDVVADGRPFHALRYVLPGVDPLEFALPRPGLALDRPRLMRGFEAALQGARGVTRQFGRAEVEPVRERGTVVGYRIEAQSASVRARTLAVADGTNGKTAPWLRAGPAARERRAPEERVARFGVRARYTAARRLDAVEVHFGRGSEVYLTPLPDDRINVVVLVSDHRAQPGGCEAILAAVLAEHPRAAQLLGARLTAPEARVLGSRVPARVALAGSFLIGDAGGGVDPILGCGVTLALESGIRAARAARGIVDGDVSGEPERDYAREYRKLTQMRRALAAFLLALSHRPLLARGTVGLARLTPGLIESLVRVAAGGEGPDPGRRAAG
jgi:flavin-dependent dehydrogenase